MTLSAEIRALAGQMTDAGHALPIGPASEALLGAAARIGLFAGEVMALEEHVRRTEWSAARAVGLYGVGPRAVEVAPISSTGVSVLPPVLTRVERVLDAAGRGDGLPAIEAQAAALLLRGALQVAAYAVRRAIEAEALEAVARDLDLMAAMPATDRDVVVPVEGGGGIVIPFDARRPGARSIPIDDGRP